MTTIDDDIDIVCMLQTEVLASYIRRQAGVKVKQLDNPGSLGTTTIILRPFVWDYPGEPVPEETFTHPPS